MTPLHPSAQQGFASGAEQYRRGRPDYPPDVATWLREDLQLGPGRVAIDLGAGTGKFTINLAATGVRVVAVEPVDAMRDELVTSVPTVEALAGTAEAIPLPDSSADAVVCAQSFHWFATETALAEVRRVLKPGGRLGLIWNVRDHSVAWVAHFTEILDAYNTKRAPRHQSSAWKQAFPAEGFGPLRHRTIVHGHKGAPDEVIVNRALSVSFIAALPVDLKREVEAKVRAHIAATPVLADSSDVTFPYVTDMYWCMKTV
jgi:SAM-dependent methyltransferase